MRWTGLWDFRLPFNRCAALQKGSKDASHARSAQCGRWRCSMWALICSLLQKPHLLKSCCLSCSAERREQALAMPTAHTKDTGATLCSFMTCLRVFRLQFLR